MGRQAPFGRYIFDFYCPKKKIAIEIDGESHRNKMEDYHKREKYIQGSGIKIVRFKISEIETNIAVVLSRIHYEMKIRDIYCFCPSPINGRE